MESKDLKNLIDYIMENNSSKEASYVLRGRKQYKFIDFKLSTSDGKIYSVIFKNGKDDIKNFDVNTEEDIQKIYDWLDKEKK